jgi:quinohemoprotein ethanol dehydrogenase
MTNHRRHAAHSALGMAALLCLSLALATGCERESAPAPSAEAPIASQAADIAWARHGLTYAEERFSPLAQINDRNVADLGLDWYFDYPAARGKEATPLVIDGVIYTTGSWSHVFAHDARSGELKWFYDPKVPRDWAVHLCCDVVNRGVAIEDGKLFFGTLDGRLVSLNAADGSLRWEVQTTDRSKPYSITGAPRIVGDKVIIGNGGAELGVRGYVSAYSVEDGSMAWRFYTVPGNPEDGFESAALERAAETWGAGRGGRSAAAARCGTPWPTTRSSTCSTSASATAHPGTVSCAVPTAATTCTCHRSWPSTPTTAATSGTTRPHPATAGTTRPRST